MKPCAFTGCGRPVGTPQSRHCHHHQDRHTAAPVRRVDTAAASHTTCPKCNGALARDGVLVSCRRRHACGWVELTSRAVRSA